MGQNDSKGRDLYVQMLKAMLKTRRNKVRFLQLIQFLDYVQDTCCWFPEEGTVNRDTWQKVEERLQGYYTADGMPIFTFSLWSQIRDCLDSTPIHKLKFSSSVSEPGGAGSFSRVPAVPSGEYQTLVNGMDSITCPTAPPLGETGPAFKYRKHKTEDSDKGSSCNLCESLS
jgi:hypothetical protein